jgi:hypothetical protein
MTVPWFRGEVGQPAAEAVDASIAVEDQTARAVIDAVFEADEFAPPVEIVPIGGASGVVLEELGTDAGEALAVCLGHPFIDRDALLIVHNHG